METNRVATKYDPLCIIGSEEITTTDNYVVIGSLDISKHPSFCLQLINNHASNVVTYKVEQTFDGVNMIEVKSATDIAGTANASFEDESIGTRVLISVKSKVSGNHASVKLFTRLKPASFIV